MTSIHHHHRFDSITHCKSYYEQTQVNIGHYPRSTIIVWIQRWFDNQRDPSLAKIKLHTNRYQVKDVHDYHIHTWLYVVLYHDDTREAWPWGYVRVVSLLKPIYLVDEYSALKTYELYRNQCIATLPDISQPSVILNLFPIHSSPSFSSEVSLTNLEQSVKARTIWYESMFNHRHQQQQQIPSNELYCPLSLSDLHQDKHGLMFLQRLIILFTPVEQLVGMFKELIAYETRIFSHRLETCWSWHIMMIWKLICQQLQIECRVVIATGSYDYYMPILSKCHIPYEQQDYPHALYGCAFKIPFEYAGKYIQSRQVYLHAGYAYITCKQIPSLYTQILHQELSWVLESSDLHLLQQQTLDQWKNRLEYLKPTYRRVIAYLRYHMLPIKHQPNTTTTSGLLVSSSLSSPPSSITQLVQYGPPCIQAILKGMTQVPIIHYKFEQRKLVYVALLTCGLHIDAIKQLVLTYNQRLYTTLGRTHEIQAKNNKFMTAITYWNKNLKYPFPCKRYIESSLCRCTSSDQKSSSTTINQQDIEDITMTLPPQQYCGQRLMKHINHQQQAQVMIHSPRDYMRHLNQMKNR